MENDGTEKNREGACIFYQPWLVPPQKTPCLGRPWVHEMHADSGRASFDDLDKNAQTVVLDGFAAGADHLRLVLADCNETNKPRKPVV